MNFKRKLLREFRSKLEETLEFAKGNYKGLLCLNKGESRFDPLTLETYSLFGDRFKYHLPQFREEDSLSLPPSHKDFSLTKANADKYSVQEESNEDLNEEFIDYRIVPVTDFYANAKNNFIYLYENSKKYIRHSRFPNNFNGLSTSLDVKIETAQTQVLVDRKVTRIRKYQSTDQGDISLWIVGYCNFIAKLGNNKDLIYTENKAIPDSYIVEITRMGDHMVFFKSTHHLLATDMQMNVIFEADIKEWFEPGDKITNCLTYEDQNLLIIGTEMGYLISMVIGFSDRSLFLKGREAYSVKPIKTIFWTVYKNMEFCSAYQEGKLIILQINEGLCFDPLRVFNYDQELSCASTFNRLGALAFKKGIVSIIEFEKGTILYSYQVPTDSAASESITWLGFLNYDIHRKTIRNSGDEYTSEQNYCEFISSIKFMVRTADDSFYMFSHASSRGKLQKTTIFEHSKHQSLDLDHQPLEPVFESSGAGCSIRFFKTTAEPLDPQRGVSQPGQPERHCCLMHELPITFSDA